MKKNLIILILAAVLGLIGIFMFISRAFLPWDVYFYLLFGGFVLFALSMSMLPIWGLIVNRLLIVRKIIKLGKPGIGYFESSQFSTFDNKYKITFSYNDCSGTSHIQRSLINYSKQASDRLAKMREFKIIFYNGRAVIDEELEPRTRVVTANTSRAAQASNSRAAQVGGAAPTTPPPAQQVFAERCRFCNSKFPHNVLNCRGCGAPA